MVAGEEVLGTFLGSEEFPIEWEEGEEELFWIYDDLHIPNPVSPMFFDIGGWWLTCDHMFRRFGTPFASDWIAKEVNGYVAQVKDFKTKLQKIAKETKPTLGMGGNAKVHNLATALLQDLEKENLGDQAIEYIVDTLTVLEPQKK